MEGYKVVGMCIMYCVLCTVYIPAPLGMYALLGMLSFHIDPWPYSIFRLQHTPSPYKHVTFEPLCSVQCGVVDVLSGIPKGARERDEENVDARKRPDRNSSA